MGGNTSNMGGIGDDDRMPPGMGDDDPEDETQTPIKLCSLEKGITAVNFMIVYNNQVVGIEAGTTHTPNTYNYPFTLFIQNSEEKKDAMIPGADQKMLCTTIAQNFKKLFSHPSVTVDDAGFAFQLETFATSSNFEDARAIILESRQKLENKTQETPITATLSDASVNVPAQVDGALTNKFVQPIAFIRTESGKDAEKLSVAQVAVVVIEVQSITTVVQILKEAMLAEIDATKRTPNSSDNFWRTPWLSKILKEEAADNPAESLVNLKLHLRSIQKIDTSVLANSVLSPMETVENMASYILNPNFGTANTNDQQDFLVRGSWALGMLAGANSQLRTSESLDNKQMNIVSRWLQHNRGTQSTSNYLLKLIGKAALTGGTVFAIWKTIKPMLMRMADGSVKEIQSARKELVVTNRRASSAILHAQEHVWVSDAAKAAYLMDILIDLQEDVSMSIGEGAELANIGEDSEAPMTDKEKQQIFAPSLAESLQKQISLLDVSDKGIYSNGEPLTAKKVASTMIQKIAKSRSSSILETPSDMF
jgi:hypothetical protein